MPPPRLRLQFQPLQQCTIRGCTARVMYAPTVSPFYREFEAVQSPLNPSHAKICDRLAIAPPDALRWHVSANSSAKLLPKGFMRSAVTRRWKHAFREALKQQGYTVDGYQRETGKRGLSGTVELSTGSGGIALDVSMEALIQQCKKVVSFIEITSKPARIGEAPATTSHALTLAAETGA
jgi:hypothetical protein